MPETSLPASHTDYLGEGLDEAAVLASPYLQARSWIDAAQQASLTRPDVVEPMALAVATVDGTGMPNVRTVLLRFMDPAGPGFVTNLGSAKSHELTQTPSVAAGLTWPSLYRAIRFRGVAHPLGRDEITEYFDSRPYGSRLSAWASHQSRPAQDRAQLERQWQEVQARFPDHGRADDVPVPDFWGGWRIRCTEVEFWAGRPNRLHDRLVFTRTGDGDLADAGSWSLSRRQP